MLRKILLLAMSSFCFCLSGAELKFNTQEFAPFNYSIDGKAAGPAVEIIALVCSEIKINCSFNILPWTRAQSEVKDGIANGMFVIGMNEKRKKWLYFSPPLLETEYGLFAHKDSSLVYKAPKNLKGLTVGVYGPSNTSKNLDKIKAKVGDLTIDMRSDDEAGFKKLQSKRVDAVFSNRDVGYALVKKLKLAGIKYVGSYKKIKYYIGFSMKHTDKKLVDKFNAAFKKLHGKGAIQKIVKKYNMTPVAL